MITVSSFFTMRCVWVIDTAILILMAGRRGKERERGSEVSLSINVSDGYSKRTCKSRPSLVGFLFIYFLRFRTWFIQDSRLRAPKENGGFKVWPIRAYHITSLFSFYFIRKRVGAQFLDFWDKHISTYTRWDVWQYD